MKAPEKKGLGRRGFFRVLGAGVAAGAAVPLAPGARADSVSADDRRKPQYRLSDEVKTYYRVNRYPS